MGAKITELAARYRTHQPHRFNARYPVLVDEPPKNFFKLVEGIAPAISHTCGSFV